MFKNTISQGSRRQANTLNDSLERHSFKSAAYFHTYADRKPDTEDVARAMLDEALALSGVSRKALPKGFLGSIVKRIDAGSVTNRAAFVKLLAADLGNL